MTNNQAPMAGGKPHSGNTPAGRVWALGIGHSLVIGHWKLVIFPAALIVGLGMYLWYRPPLPEPPNVVLDGSDPDVSAAIIDAEAAVRQSPRSAASWGRLGMLLYIHDFLAEALVCLARAEQLDPQDPHWPYYQGLALSQGDPDGSIPKLRRAAQLCPDVPDAPRLRLAETLLAQGNGPEAEEQFSRLLRQNRDHPRAHLGLARAALERGNLSDSLDHLRRASASPYAQKGAHALLAEIQQRQGEPDAAAKELSSVAALPSDLVWPDPFLEEAVRLKTGIQGVIDRASELLGRNRSREAVALLEQRLRSHGDSDWGAWLWLGRALIQEERFAAAERPLREAARLAPASVETQFYLGVARFGQGKSGQAAENFRRATELKPDYALAYYNLGHCLKQEGDRLGAIGVFRTAVQCKPNFADAHTNLGDLLAENGRYTESLVHLRHALALNPDDPRAKRLLAEVLSHMLPLIW